MSKGSKVRPGTGYATGWDAIFGVKPVCGKCPRETPYGPAWCSECVQADEKERAERKQARPDYDRRRLEGDDEHAG